MEIVTWYDWALVYLYDVGEFLFIVAAALLAVRTKKLSVCVCAVGLAMFFVGNLARLDASKELVELRQTHGDTSHAKIKHYVGSVGTSLGFLMAGVGLLVFAVRFGKEEKRG
jgi:hypothetical protein